MNAPITVKNITAGTYYIGDPGYIFGRDSWRKLIELTDCFEIPNVEYKDKPVIAFPTKSGDAVYNGFRVDSGLIENLATRFTQICRFAKSLGLRMCRRRCEESSHWESVPMRRFAIRFEGGFSELVHRR